MRINETANQLLNIQTDISQRTQCEDFDIFMFEQTWGSTALGFGGMGGQAITAATTFVLIPYDEDCAFVYFGYGFAYRVDKPNKRFKEDILHGKMASVRESGRYRKED